VLIIQNNEERNEKREVNVEGLEESERDERRREIKLKREREEIEQGDRERERLGGVGKDSK